MSAHTFEEVPIEGEAAVDLLRQSDKETSHVWAFSPLDEVKRAMQDTGYAKDKIFFIKGRVEETIPLNAPAQIAILLLDTNCYASSYHELVHLYPRLRVGGVLIIDDSGHWQGARRAVDEYFSQQKVRAFLNRIDYTGRLCVKPA